MLRAWRQGPRELSLDPQCPEGREENLVRSDCPAFAGYHAADGQRLESCTTQLADLLPLACPLGLGFYDSNGFFYVRSSVAVRAANDVGLN